VSKKVEQLNDYLTSHESCKSLVKRPSMASVLAVLWLQWCLYQTKHNVIRVRFKGQYNFCLFNA